MEGYKIEIGIKPDVACIEITPPLRPEHEQVLAGELNSEDTPLFINEGSRSVLWMEPYEPLSQNIFESGSEEEAITADTIARAKEIGSVLSSLEDVQVVYDSDLGSEQMPIAA